MKSVSNISENSPLTLPPRARLVHVGPPKTGTTAVQRPCAQARSELFKNGVYYPGNKTTQRREIFSFRDHLSSNATAPQSSDAMMSHAGFKDSGSQWGQMLDGINKEKNKRIFISEEAIAAHFSDMHMAQFAEQLDRERIHIAITLRSFPDILLSQWNQTLKLRSRQTLEEWLSSFYGLSDMPLPIGQRRSLNFSELVERWVNVVGSDRITVVIPGRQDRDLLQDTFEQLLGLPGQTLIDKQASRGPRNRSLTTFEAEVIRRVNERLREIDGISWDLYAAVIKGNVAQDNGGAIRTMLAERCPKQDESRLLLPRWAAERAINEGKRHAEKIENSGVRVVGKLENLYAVPTAIAEDVPVLDDARLDMTVESLVGAVQGAAKIEKRAARRAHPVKNAVDTSGRQNAVANKRMESQDVALSFTTRDLYRAIKIRLKHKLRTGQSMQVRQRNNG